MAFALLGKCVTRLALILILYICYIYAFKIRDGSVVNPFSSSTIGEHSQRATCIGSKFGKCPEKTVTTSSAVTSSSRRWHTATSSQVSSIGKKPPVETVSSTLEGDTNIQKIGSRLISTQHSDKSLPGFLVRRKENIVDDKNDDDKDDDDENDENEGEERNNIEDTSNNNDDDDDYDDVVVEDEEEEEIQAEDEDDENEDLSKDDQSEDKDEDDEYDEQYKSIERKETKREAEIKDKEKEDHERTMNVPGWSFKYSADSFSKSMTTKDTKEMKYGKGIVQDEGKEKKMSSIVKEKEDKKDIVKDNIKIEEESSIGRRQQKKMQRRDLGQVEESDKRDDSKDKNEDKNYNVNEGEDQSKVTPSIIRKLEKIRHADKDIIKSIERPVSKSIDKIKLETTKPMEKIKKEVNQIMEESKKIETTKPTKTETTEEKEVKETKSTKVTRIKVEEKKVKKSESIESTKDKSDEDKKTKKTDIVKATKSEPESSKPSLKSEEKRKPVAKTETPKTTTPKTSTKTKNEVDKSIKAKVKIELPQMARNETKSKTKKIRDATESLADLNDKILNVPTFLPNFTAIENINCQQHGKIFLRQLRGYKLWAFQMLDSSAKISSSILRGNVNQLGDFDQCLGIMSHVKMGNRTIKIQGKYCLASIDIHATQTEMKLPVNLIQARTLIKSNIRDPGNFIPKFTTIKWGLCLPAACTEKDAEMTLINALNYYNTTSGIRFMVDVNSDMCYTKQKSQNYSKETIGVLYFYVAVVCLVIIATIRDYLITSEGKANYSERIIMSFSLRRTVKSLFKKKKPNSTDITCIHGLRSIFMIFLYLGHKSMSLGFLPFVNRTSLSEHANHPLSILLRASSIFTDGFLLLSGLLTSYNMAKELTFRGEIRWFCRLIVRFIRLTPALIVMIFWYAFVMEHIGSGPQWKTAILDNAELCKKNSWTNLLYIQNFFPLEEMCAGHTHQLALDMQLSLLAPILVFFLQCKPIIGIILLFFLIQVSATLRYIATVNNYLSMIIYHGITLRNLYKSANLSYTLPLHRLTPYAFGVGLGVLLHYTGKNVKIHKVFMILGWLIAMTFGTWSTFSFWRSATRNYVYDVEESTYYVVFVPVLWALSLCWTIFACFTDHGGILNKFLSSYWFIVFSRISYAVYLTQFPIFFYNIGTTRYTTEFLLYRSIDLIEILVVILVSIVITLLFDFPMQEIKNVIMESTDSLAVNVPAEKQANETKETNAMESVKKISNGSKVFKDDDWQNGKIDRKLNNKNIEDKGIVNISRTKRSDERRRLSTGYDDDDIRSRINRSNQRIPYMFDSEEEAMEYFRKEEETIRNRRSVSRTKEMKRSMPIETEDDYIIRRRNEEDYANQYRRSKSKERLSARDLDDYRSWEFVNKERSASTGPDSMRFFNEPDEEYVSRISRHSLQRSIDSRRILSSESEDEPPVHQRRSKNERRYPSVEPKVSDEEEWEEELRIRRRQFMEKLAGQKSGSSEKEGDVTSLRRRSSAEGRIALLKDPSGNENMDAWTVSVGPRIAQLGSSQEPSEPEDDSFYHQRREYREKAPPFRETPHTEVKETSLKDDKDVTHFNFLLTKDSKRKSVQDLSTLSQDDSDLTESGWSLVKDEVVENLPKSSLGLYKRESIIKSQASEEDPEYYLPERPKLVQQEQEHPFKKAWQMQKSRSEEDALAYIVKDKKLSQSETTKDDESSTSMEKDTSAEKSESLEDTVSEETGTLSSWQDKSTDTEDNPQSSKSEIESDIDSISVRQSPNTDVGDSGPCSISENDSDAIQFVWPTEDEQFETYKTGPRRKSMETNWDWEEEET